jgi:hypothetical protein
MAFCSNTLYQSGDDSAGHVIHCFVVTKKHFFGYQFSLILLRGRFSVMMSIQSTSDWKCNEVLQNVYFSPRTVTVI